LVDRAGEKMQETGVGLLWGTANLFAHPRYAAGAATNPDPKVFAYAVAQVRDALEATHRLDGANYVLWGGREGYETLLNTRLRQEADQLARFLELVANQSAASGSRARSCSSPNRRNPPSISTTTTAPRCTAFSTVTSWPTSSRSTSRPTTRRWLDTRSTTRSPTPSTTASSAASTPTAAIRRTGGDTDQFPNSVEDLAPAVYEILRSGGFTTGGFNFDTKLRR
jgi:xylose isomerase